MPFLPRIAAWLATITLLGVASLAGAPETHQDAPGAPPAPIYASSPSDPWDVVSDAQESLRISLIAAAEAEAAVQAQIASEAAEVARWEGLIRCEMGGDWHISGPVHSGLGFNNQTWLAYGGAEFAADAGRATPYQQTIIASRVRDAVGAGAWNSCGVHVPR